MSELAIFGGKKTCDFQWPGWPVYGDKERNALLEVLESGKWWYGEKVQEFESKFAEFQNAKYGVTATSGTTALESALNALGIGAGDEVIVPPYTFMATASAVLRVNAIPIFADIEPDTFCIDPEDVKHKVTDRTKAIIPVHLAGHVADMDRLWEIARKHDLYLIEDACHAWGSQWNGKGVGAVGHCGVFSFQASKNINSAEGGIMLTDHEWIADACRSITNCGRSKTGAWYEHHVIGSNLRLTEFQAAILLAQLTRLESQTMKRMQSVKIIEDVLRDVPGIHLTRHDDRMTRRSYHFYPFRLDLKRLGMSRARFIEACEAEGIPLSPGYTMPLYKNPMFLQEKEGPANCPFSCPYYDRKIDYAGVNCPVCEEVCNDTCWITHPMLLADETNIAALANGIKKVCENAGELA
ncbi:DegT/DnrJ/EryC1/StrS family aminotransferase [bacterium]|nr:DegT/DnrJ/EryC1/StrS family aminotransferase [bacterium]